MGFSIGLGRTGSAVQWYLPGTDTSHLPSLPLDAPAPEAGAIEEVWDANSGGATLLHGLVGVTGDAGVGAGLVLDVLGAWNTVKNASVQSDHAGRVTLSGFVHADVSMGDGGDSFVDLHGAKRGNVETGNGADVVTIEAASNVWVWVNEFRVATSAGDDVVVVRALDVAAAAAGDPTFASTASDAGAFTGTDSRSVIYADLGDGDDRFFASGESADHVWAGEGDDIIRAGHAADVLAGGDGRDLFLFAMGDGADTILDFHPSEDRISFGLGPAATRALLATAVEGDGSTTIVYGADSVTLVGVVKSELTASDLL